MPAEARPLVPYVIYFVMRSAAAIRTRVLSTRGGIAEENLAERLLHRRPIFLSGER